MQDLKKMIQYVWQYLKVHKKIVYFYVLIVALNELVDMANSLVLGMTIDNMLQAGTRKAIVSFAFMFMGLNIVTFVVCYFAQVWGTKAMELCRVEVKRQLSKHVEKTSLNYCGGLNSMSFMQRLNFDSAYLVIFVINSYGKIVSKMICFIFAAVIIFKINVVCGIVALAELPVIFVLYRCFQDTLLERERVCAEKRELGNRSLYELLANVKHIKNNQIFSLLEKRYMRAAGEEIEAVVSATKLDYIYSIVNENMDMFLRVFLFFYGGICVLNGKMTVGEFTIIYSYFSIITASCSYFLNFGKSIQDNKAYYERLKEITDVAEETNGMVQLPSIDRIDFSHVKFGYNETETIVRDFSYTFRKGNMYVVAGSNGSGKSTIISLLLGMYIDECQGEIKYNGHSIRELDMRTLRKERVGVCEQEPYLIEDTIRYNMIYSNNTTDDEVLMKLAYQVSFDEFLKNSEKGLDTPVGEGGNALSGGQKQKTALVKAFYKNPDVLVLDEPTSAMDADGQERFKNYLTSIKKDKIIIAVTHDERMILAADEVIRM